MIVVCNYCQLLERENGKFKVDGAKKVLHPNTKVTKDYAEEINASAIDSGRFYEVIDEATQEFHKAQAEKKEVDKAKEELEKVTKADLIEAVATKSTRKPKAE